MKTIDVLHLPKSLWLGRRGENQFRPIAVKWEDWHRDYPDATLSVIYHRPDGQDFVVATSTNTPLIWTPMQDVTTVSGVGELEMHLVDDPEIGISAHVETIIDDSRSNASVQGAPAWVDQVVADVAAEADRAEAAADSVGEQVEEVVAEAVPVAVAEYIEDHPIVETDPTVPAWAKQPTKPTYTASEVGALPSDTPIPAEVTEQTVAGWGFTKNTGTYSKPSGGIPDSDIASAANWNAKGTYSKPSGGIPKSDLASDVQTSLGKADTALQQHQSLAGYATESYVQQQIAAIPDELPVVSASDNGKVLGVVNGAWSVKSDEGGGGGSAPFEIPVTESGDIYSTTATAADILANVDNCVISMSGSILYPVAYMVNSSDAIIVFEMTNAVNGYVQNVTIQIAVQNGTVTIQYYDGRANALPTVSATDNGKFLRVVNGAWAAATVPSAESNSFGGGA